jgi:hypothetical protein
MYYCVWELGVYHSVHFHFLIFVSHICSKRRIQTEHTTTLVNFLYIFY